MVQFVANVEDATPGKMIDFDLYGTPALLINDGEELRAFLNICPHRGGPMELQNGNGSLRCQWHDSIWSLRGSRLSGPSADTICLIPVEIYVENGHIYAR